MMSYDISKQESQCVPGGPIVRQTLRERLEEQRITTKQYLDGIESAIKFIDDHPDFENFHNTLRKIGF